SAPDPAMQSASASSPEPSVEGEVGRIRSLLEAGRFEPALAGAASLARRVPENRDVLYMMAVCQRYLHKIPEALSTLAQLQEVHPGFSRLYQERGHCYVALR